MRKIHLIVLACFFAFAGSVKADEGMWLPALIHKLNIGDMQKMGLQLNAEDIYSINHSSLKDAIVVFGGGCTAEVVSNEGLLFTNHHCGFDAIQRHSTTEHDYLRDGFWSKTKAEELPNPGLSVRFLIRCEEVTNKIVPYLNDQMSEKERKDKIKEISNQVSQEATKDTHYQATVEPMFNDNQYYLFVYEKFNDVRLVGAPPSSLGKFGGDTDNWMWPRQTADFSIFRIYCGKDGKPADYSPDNVPYRPKHFLPISLKGVSENDFAMILGYPGSTSRYKTSFGIDYSMNVSNKIRIQVEGVALKIMQEYMASSQKARIQYSTKQWYLSNGYKYALEQNKSLAALHIVESKKAFEDQFVKWVNQNEERKAKYGECLKLIQNAYGDMDLNAATAYFRETVWTVAEIFGFANGFQSFKETLKDETQKEKIKSDAEFIKQMSENFFKDYDLNTDIKITASCFEIYKNNTSAKYQPDFFKEVERKYKGNFEKYLFGLYSKSILTDKDRLFKFLSNPTTQALDKDKLFQMFLQLAELNKSIKTARQELLTNMSKGDRLFLAGVMEMEKDRKFYPDASANMRLSYGKVGGYKPCDGTYYNYYTTLAGYIEKEIPGDVEFDVPSRLKELYYAKDFGSYADKDGTLHTCFLTNNDITGGSSGSPVINAKGELIGLAFDGNSEAMSCDIAFEKNLQRTINVDIRFVLWIIDKYAGANNLIQELNIVH